jgi:PilZ domain
MEKKARPKLKVKRQQVRRRRHQSAWITLEDGTANCRCQVEDVSRSGAKITVDRTVEVGRLFGIAFVPRATARRCEVVWRRGNTLGIRFIGSGQES